MSSYVTLSSARASRDAGGVRSIVESRGLFTAYSAFSFAFCARIIAGFEAFLGGLSAVYLPPRRMAEAVTPSACLVQVLNIRHLMPSSRLQKRALGMTD